MKPFLLTICLLSGLSSLAQDVDRGAELYKKGDYSEAETALRGAVEQQGDNAKANRLLGLTLLEQKKVSDAEPFIVKADQLESSGDTKAALARLYIEKKEYDKAEASLKDASGDEATYARGLLDLNRKRFEPAAKNFESFIENNPHHAYAHYNAGMAYNGMKRPDKMLTHFELFLKLAPDAPEARKVKSVLQSVR